MLSKTSMVQMFAMSKAFENVVEKYNLPDEACNFFVSEFEKGIKQGEEAIKTE